jgi:hypothetical protein
MATKNEIWCETPRSSGLTGPDGADGADGDEDVETSWISEPLTVAAPSPMACVLIEAAI